MGCRTYDVNDWSVHFSESDDDVGCLCTFPHNDGDRLSPERVRSLAMLGAVVVLAHQSEAVNGWLYVPGSLPNWMRREIERLIPE